MSARPESDPEADPAAEGGEAAPVAAPNGDEGAARGGGQSGGQAGAAARLDADTLVALVAGIAGELRAAGEGAPRVGLDTDLGRDLGLDSLTRMELLARLERAAGASLPDRVLAEAATPRELLRAFASVRPTGPEADRGPAEPGGSCPGDASGDALDASRDRPVEGPARVSGPDTAPGEDAVPTDTRTLVDALAWHASAHPSGPTSVSSTNGMRRRSSPTARSSRARTASRPGSSGAGSPRGGRSRSCSPTGIDYLQCFLGVQIAGGVPLPIYPPARLAQLEDHLRRHERILENADAEWLVTFDEARQVSRLLAARASRRCRVATVRELAEPGASAPDLGVSPGPDDIAFLQYTSGSTGQPKGVVLTHHNVLASLDAMAKALSATPRDVFVSWLPLYHDLGLIAAWLGSLVYGFPLVLMSPLTFLARPARWLRAVHRYRGTLSGGPNFAFELCTRRIADEEIEGLDLSSWRLAFNGAEPVHPDTLDAFAGRFAPFGFDPNALAPVYGLAEATLGVAFTPVGRGPLVERVARTSLERERRAEPAAAGDGTALRFVSSGVPIPGFEVRTVDDGGRETPERVEGRLQFRGPSTTGGYFRDRAATAALFDGDWLESGDLAYVAGGELFITGRVKDVVIRAGRNLHPYDFEQAAGDPRGSPARLRCALLRPGSGRRGGRHRAPRGDRGDPGDGSGAAGGDPRRARSPRRRTARPAGRRGGARAAAHRAQDFERQDPPALDGRALRVRGARRRGGARPLWVRVARLAAGGAGPAVRRAARRIGDLAFAGWFWSALALVGVIPALAAMIARRPRFGFACVRAVARVVFRLAGVRLTVEGAEHLRRDGACVIASNHASYLDALALAAAFPRPVRFVAKAELRDHRLARWLLDGIGVLYVDRFDIARSVAHAGGLAEALRAGDRIAIFPEGTLHRMPGLLPFQLGAFMVAAEGEAPVVPVVLRGTRSLMRDGTWFPRRAPVHVRIGEPVAPPAPGLPAPELPSASTATAAAAAQGSAWSRAVGLRDVVRGWMLAHCGEPDLASRNPLRDLIERRTGTGTGSAG